MLRASPRHYPCSSNYVTDGVAERVPLALLRRVVDLGSYNSRYRIRLPLLPGAVRGESGVCCFFSSESVFCWFGPPPVLCE